MTSSSPKDVRSIPPDIPPGAAGAKGEAAGVRAKPCYTRTRIPSRHWFELQRSWSSFSETRYRKPPMPGYGTNQVLFAAMIMPSFLLQAASKRNPRLEGSDRDVMGRGWVTAECSAPCLRQPLGRQAGSHAFGSHDRRRRGDEYHARYAPLHEIHEHRPKGPGHW